jgi:hypothetical protein
MHLGAQFASQETAQRAIERRSLSKGIGGGPIREFRGALGASCVSADELGQRDLVAAFRERMSLLQVTREPRVG